MPLDEGDVLQIVGGHQAFAAPTGGTQVVTLLGPLPFAFDSPNIANQYKVADLDTGTVVIKAWIEITEDFNADPALAVEVGLGGPLWDDPDDLWSPIVWDAGPTLQTSPGPYGYVIELSNTATATGRVSGPHGVLVVSYGGANAMTPPTQGAGVVYALIATPA